MTNSQPEDAFASSKYNIHIHNVQGLIIGDHGQIVQTNPDGGGLSSGQALIKDHATRVLPYEPETILIPAGQFLMGSEPGPTIPVAETPQHTVSLPAYRMGKYPITNQEYAEFLHRSGYSETPRSAGWFLHEPSKDKFEHPVTGISWYDAKAYCHWLREQTGRAYRLPTEAEWEKAARGADGRLYPWGAAWIEHCCNVSTDETTAVTLYEKGASPYGCLDMVGNAQEWTSTLWGSDPQQAAYLYPYCAEDGREDASAEQRLHRTYRIHRGGAFREQPTALRCSMRGIASPDSKIRWRGFRVVMEI